MSTLQKTKSPLGKNGPDAKLEDLAPELTQAPDSSNEPIILNPAPDSSPEPAPDAGVVVDSVKPVVNVPLSVTDLKLARQMNKAISDVLGLSRKSRSVKV